MFEGSRFVFCCSFALAPFGSEPECCTRSSSGPRSPEIAISNRSRHMSIRVPASRSVHAERAGLRAPLRGARSPLMYGLPRSLFSPRGPGTTLTGPAGSIVKVWHRKNDREMPAKHRGTERGNKKKQKKKKRKKNASSGKTHRVLWV